MLKKSRIDFEDNGFVCKSRIVLNSKDERLRNRNWRIVLNVTDLLVFNQ